jgi:hypothetical protein
MGTKTLMLATILWLGSSSLAHAGIVLSVGMNSDNDGNNLELQAWTISEDPECGGNVFAEAQLYINNQLIDFDWLGGQTCNATAMTVRHDRPWDEVVETDIYESAGNGSGAAGSACETQTYRVEFFDAPYKRTQILSPTTARYSRCSSGRCGTLDLNTTVAFVYVHVTHVYLGEFPNDLTLQCYSRNYQGILSCSDVPK